MNEQTAEHITDLLRMILGVYVRLGCHVEELLEIVANIKDELEYIIGHPDLKMHIPE